MARGYLVSSFYLKIKNRLTFSQILQSAFAKDFFVKKRKVRVPYFFCRKKRACATIFFVRKMMILIMNCKACATTFSVGKKRACAKLEDDDDDFQLLN